MRIRTAPIALITAVCCLAACGSLPSEDGGAAGGPSLPFGLGLPGDTREMYAEVEDGGHTIPAIEAKYLTPERVRQEVDYYAPHPVGTIVVDPGARKLYHVQEGDRAMRYAVAVGAAGLSFSGTARVAFQRDWPYWTPTQNMIRRDPETYEPVKNGLPGGMENPLGARALYLYRNGRDTLYRIHGTPSPWTIGHATSSGCIRMFNQDAIHLAAQVENGTKVIVLTKEQSGQWTTSPDMVAEADTAEDASG